MNIIDFLEAQVEKWNEDNFCDSCWSFSFPLTEARMNVQQSTEDNQCCAKAMVTNLTENIVTERTPQGSIFNKYIENSFDFHLLVHSNLGQNMYNEVQHYDIEDGLWEQKIKQLWECANADMFYDQCEILGYDLQIRSFFKRIVTDYLDENYAGIKITMTTRTYVN